MTQVKRYDLFDNNFYPCHRVEEFINGKYVTYEDYQKLQEQLGKAEAALNKAINAADFFSRHADCRKDSWACKCEFCRDTTSTKNLNDARQYFKEKENND